MKPAAENKKTGIDKITTALKDAGYKILKFGTKPGAHTVQLTPANHGVDPKSKVPVKFPAATALQAMGLQCSCNVFAAVPQDILIVTIPQPAPEAPKATKNPALGTKD